MFRLKKQGPIARFLTLAAILCAVWTSVCAAEAMPPVSYTAYTSLYWLWEAGVPEAAEFSEAIGGEKVSLSKDSVPHYEELAPVNKLYIEMRYAALNEYIAGNRYQNVLDVACGFAPRSIAMARQGRMFVGTDFAPSIAEIRTVLPDCLSRKQQKRVHYAIADAKDQVGMMRAADRLEGPVCITMDGLMMYLTREEQATVLKNTKAILEKHGGATSPPISWRGNSSRPPRRSSMTTRTPSGFTANPPRCTKRRRASISTRPFSPTRTKRRNSSNRRG